MKVGYIGLGRIGKPIAANVVRAGFDLMVYDLRREPLEEMARLGAKVARSSREVGAHAELIELSVAGDAQVRDVILGKDGVLATARAGSIIAIHSTVHPATVRAVAEAARARGVDVLDAQVSGGSGGAQAQTLCYMVGGDQAVLERCRPVFQASGSQVFHMGELGAGSAAKLAQQIMTVVTMLAVSEGMRVAQHAGLDIEQFEQLVRVSAGQSYVANHWRTVFARLGDAVPGFYEGLVPALALGHDLGIFLPGTALAQQLLPAILDSRD